MGLLKGIGYVLAGFLVVCVLLASGTVIAALVAGAGIVLFLSGLVALASFSIKEYCESVSDRKGKGQDRGSQESS